MVVDRLVRRDGIERRLTESMETALGLAEGVAEIEIVPRDADSETEKVQHTHKIRTSNEIFDPGGGGINVARMIAELGGPALAIR